MRLRHFSAVKTLNGKLSWRLKKWRFSLTKASASVHSVYAAMNASAGFNPLASYLKTVSKGTTKSSSTVVKALISSLNSTNASVDKLRLTSLNIVRGMRMAVCAPALSSRQSNSRRDSSRFNGPKAKIYSLESMTKRSFFLPDGFPGLSKGLDDVIFAHLENRRRVFSDYLPEFLQMFYGFFGFVFYHCSLPPIESLLWNICAVNNKDGRFACFGDSFRGILRSPA